MMKPRTDRSAERALVVAILALVFLKQFGPSLQMAGAVLTGAVMPNHSSSSTFGGHPQRVEIHSIGGDRRVLGGAKEDVAAVHLLVILPAKEATQIPRQPDPANSLFEHTTGGTYRLDDGAHRGAIVRAEATYDLFRRTATIGGVRYRLSRGNLFVVRVDENLHPVVTQLDESFGEMGSSEAMLRVFHSATRSDPAAQRALSPIVDVRRGVRRNCLRTAPPAAAT